MRNEALMIKKMLEQHVSEMASMLHRHENETLRLLVLHQHRMTELQLKNVPALQEEVIGGMERWLKGIITEEAGLADADDARYLLRTVERMKKELTEKGRL